MHSHLQIRTVFEELHSAKEKSGRDIANFLVGLTMSIPESNQSIGILMYDKQCGYFFIPHCETVSYLRGFDDNIFEHHRKIGEVYEHMDPTEMIKNRFTSTGKIKFAA